MMLPVTFTAKSMLQFKEELTSKMATSPTPGTAIPGDPPEEAALFNVLFQFPADPIQYLFVGVADLLNNMKTDNR
jgi:hypothetical protein